MESTSRIFNAIGRTHMYWGRKPIPDLLEIFKDVRKGSIVLDPFCGGGTPAVAALLREGRVIASDLNPMGVFLTKVLIRPISIASLVAAFDRVKEQVASKIAQAYAIKCPVCGQDATVGYLVWLERTGNTQLKRLAIRCSRCGQVVREALPRQIIEQQMEVSQQQPTLWYPKRHIHSRRIAPVEYHHELFTGRNLSMLAELFHELEHAEPENCRDALRYVFTAMLYSCSNMQMFSEQDPSSSRGWTALRFYVPPARKELNVWNAFEGRFRNLIKCKKLLNLLMPSIHVTDSQEEFFSSDCEALVFKGDAFSLSDSLFGVADHVFLDPPYNDDIEYLAFSEFWGAWLKMRFDWETEWHSEKDRVFTLKGILESVRNKTRQSCQVVLAFAPKGRNEFPVESVIQESGYGVERCGGFLYDNSHKRGGMDRRQDVFFVLRKASQCHSGSPPSQLSRPSLREVSQIFPYLQVSAFLWPGDSSGLAAPEGIRGQAARIRKPPQRRKRRKGKWSGDSSGLELIRAQAARIRPLRLGSELRDVKGIEITEAIRKPLRNKRAYHTLCYALLRPILQKDGWQCSWVARSQFEKNVLGVSFSGKAPEKPGRIPAGVVLVAARNDKRLLFCFEDQGKEKLARIPTRISRIDRGTFKNIPIMIVPSAKKMREWRQVKEAANWRGGFFVSFEDIQRKAEQLDSESYLELCATNPVPRQGVGAGPGIAAFRAEVTANIPMGGPRGKTDHYILRFKAPELQSVIPGQFIMMDTRPTCGFARDRTLSREEMTSFDLSAHAFLKRPFGVHRASYPGFRPDYLKNLLLPRTLSTILHTVLPTGFDIFYKVVENGTGTREMTRLKEGDRVQMVGPLGKPFDLRKLRADGFEEIHVIGGGVGMVPLVFMVQALRFFAFDVKCFLGIESVEMLRLEMLRHTDDLATGFGADPSDMYIYVDDLRNAGVRREDIFVSSFQPGYQRRIAQRSNFRQGLVSQQYEEYLAASRGSGKIAAFTCGPMPMMKAIARICERYGIRLMVFMEKRMACGIGVCLSCVCRTQNGKPHYSRVCTEGPIFEANEVVWD